MLPNKLLELLYFIVYFILNHRNTISAYRHVPCNTRAIRSEFSSYDNGGCGDSYSSSSCYVPSLSPDLDISEASFVLSHNAATGYIDRNSISKTGLSWWYSKNQVGDAYQQLNDGARALDLRPKFYNATATTSTSYEQQQEEEDGAVIFAHGDINIPISFEYLVQDVIRWCNDNPTELVLLFTSHYSYTSQSELYIMLSTIQQVYQKYGIAYLNCNDVYGLSVGEVMELSSQFGGGGYVVAIDGQDGYTSCVRENWDPSVTCYDKQMNVSCRVNSNVPYESKMVPYLWEAISEGQNPSQDYPFNEIQALWQVDSYSAIQGIRRVSSILDDNKLSKINSKLVDFLYDVDDDDEGYDGYGGNVNENENNNNGGGVIISLVAVDNVALHGNALLSVLRNRCGQSDETANNKCGKKIPKPKMLQPISSYLSLKNLVYGIIVLYAVTSIFVTVWMKYYYYKGNNNDRRISSSKRLWNTFLERCWNINTDNNNDTTTTTTTELITSYTR